MADPSGLQPPMLDPSQYPAYMDAQRKQQIAQMLMGAFQQSQNSPDPRTGVSGPSGAVTPRRGMLQNLAPLVSALMAGKAMKESNTAQQTYMQGLYGGGQPAAPPTGPGDGVVSPDAPPAAQAAAQGVSAQPGLLPQAPQQQNSMLPPNMGRGQGQMLLNMMGPEKYAETFISPQYKQPEIIAQLRYAGIDPMGKEGQAVQQAALKKATTNLQEVKIGSTMFDVNKGVPVFTGPDNGIQTNWGPNGPTQSPIPGALTAERDTAAAKTAGTQGQIPVEAGVSATGEKLYKFVTPPASAGGTASRSGASQTASPAVQQSQKSGAEAGQTYASELAKNATGATEVRRSISELKNLSAQATPGAANEAKAKLGAFMIAAGADPANVSKWTGVDTGALQAAQKQTATLAVNSIHSMTSRGTNFDLDTFMRNNPNMNMADPAAFGRVADYMNNKAGQDIAKQKDFAQWKKSSGVSPDDWETQHTAHWLDHQNQAINQGQSNSRVPGAPVANLAELQAEARKRGLIK
jgi:hypothetical protein